MIKSGHLWCPPDLPRAHGVEEAGAANPGYQLGDEQSQGNDVGYETNQIMRLERLAKVETFSAPHNLHAGEGGEIERECKGQD